MVTAGDDGKAGLFGKVLAYTYVIEFQKRGLPHAHLLLIMDRASKPKCAADIDRHVQAEIPTGAGQERFRAIVERCMMHGPCGDLNPQCVCMANGVCTNNYPKEFQPETVWCANGYPKYRRREHVNGLSIVSTDQRQDNRWVVPHNRQLLETFDCHINVEICTSIKTVKYLYKYSNDLK